MDFLKKLNGIKSQNKHEYFGTFNGIDWSISGYRDGNKVWWYLTDNEGENPTPANNLNEALKFMYGNLTYNPTK